MRDACNGDTELLGELDDWFEFQFLAPVGAVEDAFGFVGEGEEVLAVEAGGAAGEAGVEKVEMVSACYLWGWLAGWFWGRKREDRKKEGGGSEGLVTMKMPSLFSRPSTSLKK